MDGAFHWSVMHSFPWNEDENVKMYPFVYAEECPVCQAFFNFQPWALGYSPQCQGFKLMDVLHSGHSSIHNCLFGNWASQNEHPTQHNSPIRCFKLSCTCYSDHIMVAWWLFQHTFLCTHNSGCEIVICVHHLCPAAVAISNQFVGVHPWGNESDLVSDIQSWCASWLARFVLLSGVFWFAWMNDCTHPLAQHILIQFMISTSAIAALCIQML